MKNALVFSCMILFAQVLFAQVHYSSVEIYSQTEMNESAVGVIVQGDLIINGRDLENLDNISTLVMVTGNLVIKNTSLKNATSLVNLNAIGGDLIIEGNQMLENLDGFQNLLHIGGNLVISNNKGLENLDGLNLIESLFGNLVVNNNSNLIDLEGLSNINKVVGHLEITNNNIMADCCTLASLVHFKKDSQTFIYGNPVSCSSKDIILESCTEKLPAYKALASRQSKSNQMEGQVSPNPTQGLFTISIETKTSQVLDISVFDLSGRTIVTQAVNVESGMHAVQVDGANWISGVYLVRIQTEEGIYQSRLVKK